MVRTQGAVSGNVNAALQDKNGRIWFATGGEGLYCYGAKDTAEREKTFTHFTVQNGLSSNQVNALVQDRPGHLLLGTSNGICRYDGKTFVP